MTNTTNDTNVSPLNPEETEVPVVEKQSFVQKTKQFVGAHKKSTIAVGALVGLVGLAAVTGRKTAPTPGYDSLTEEEKALTPDDVLEMIENNPAS